MVSTLAASPISLRPPDRTSAGPNRLSLECRPIMPVSAWRQPACPQLAAATSAWQPAAQPALITATHRGSLMSPVRQDNDG